MLKFVSSLFAAVLFCLTLSATPPRAQTTETLWQEAVALMQEGRAAEAVPLLDRLVSAVPDNRSYRLELGYALFQTGQYARARYHLDRARAGNANPVEISAANRLIAEADARRVLTGYATFAIRPETNPGKQTDQPILRLFGRPFEVETAKRETTYIVTTGAQARPVLNDHLRLSFGIDTWSRFAETRALRDHILSLRAGPVLTFENGVQLEIGAVVRRRWTEGDHRSDTTGGYAQAFLPIGQRASAVLRMGREEITYFDGSVPEEQRRLQLQFNYLATPSLLLRAALDATRTDAPLQAAAGDKREWRIGANKSFTNGIDLRGDLWHRTDTRDGPDRIFGVVRKDTIRGLELAISDRDLRLGPFVPELIVGAEKSVSSIDFYDYDNAYVNFGLRTTF